MSNPFYLVRRQLAQEMNLWGGSVDGQSPAPATFSKVDTQGSLYVVYDINRPEPDADWNGAYVCINPGGTGNGALSTIWRRIADDSGFVNSTGAMTLTSPLPSSAYAQTSMTYELFKQFTPEQWLMAVNFALRTSYPQRHRIVSFEAPEDPDSQFYDWGHLASALSMTDPTVAPTVTGQSYTGGKDNTWATGTFTVGYNWYNAAGETLVGPTSTVGLGPSTILEFAAITAPQGAIGLNYWCTESPGGTVLSMLTSGSGILPDNATVRQFAGVADPSTFIVPRIQFYGPPRRLSRRVPLFNTTGLDLGGLSLKTVRRRVNPGGYPEKYLDLNPQWWREMGGTTIKLEASVPNTNLRFECMLPLRALSGESDTAEEPLELMIAGGMLYLWNQLAMSGSAQNVVIWQAEAKIADNRFTKARNLYQQPGPRKTMRRPFIEVQS